MTKRKKELPADGIVEVLLLLALKAGIAEVLLLLALKAGTAEELQQLTSPTAQLPPVVTLLLKSPKSRRSSPRTTPAAMPTTSPNRRRRGSSWVETPCKSANPMKVPRAKRNGRTPSRSPPPRMKKATSWPGSAKARKPDANVRKRKSRSLMWIFDMWNLPSEDAVAESAAVVGDAVATGATVAAIVAITVAADEAEARATVGEARAVDIEAEVGPAVEETSTSGTKTLSPAWAARKSHSTWTRRQSRPLLSRAKKELHWLGGYRIKTLKISVPVAGGHHVRVFLFLVLSAPLAAMKGT